MVRFKRERSCQRVRGMLSEYIDNRLDTERKTLVERHLESCEACLQELAHLKAAVQLLHRVSQVPVPRSFAIAKPEPRRESALGPSSLRWLRPATAVATIALIALLMLDFLPVFERSGGGPVYEASNRTATLNMTPGQGNVTVGLVPEATSTPSQDGTLKDGKPGEQAGQPIPPGGGEMVTEGVVQGETEAGWSLRPAEIALGAVVVALAALTVFAIRRRTKEEGVK